ncbi:MAG: acyl-CoA dehydrogenase family protein [Thermoplasmatales archaeon]|nr:MAG: acyl-CoA dehydrogenase family protein [Thermoplasmatales archaeon]
MDFTLNSEEELFRKTIATFVEKEVMPVADELENKGEFPNSLFQRAGNLGYFGLRYPTKYGGTETNTIMFCILCEELARGWLSLAMITAMQSLMGTNFIYRFGTEDQKKDLLVPAIKGEKIAAFALTEPGAGTDLESIQTTAKKENNHYILNGNKTWITNAPVADFFTVLAYTDKSKGLKGVNFFLVEKGTPGFSIGKKIDKISVRGGTIAEISFDECKIPLSNMLGKDGEGYPQLQGILAEIRVMTGALSVGLARRALEECIKYSQERKQFGRPIGKFQAIRMKLGEIATDLEAARLLVYYAAWLIDQKKSCMKEASMAKLFASEMANRVVDEATRIHGAYGIAEEFPIQRLFRDARFLLYGGGTSEILKLIIGREMK